MIALFLVTEPLMGYVVEPMVYGHSTGLSPVSVVVAAIFWTWLWGPIGLILSTPLTLCLVVLGRHVERLEFLDVLLGDASLFPRNEEVEESWRVVDPIEVHWAERTEAGEGPHPYRAGSWGPEAAYDMLARDGRAWRRP